MLQDVTKLKDIFLINLIKNGNEEAFNELYRRHLPILQKLAKYQMEKYHCWYLSFDEYLSDYIVSWFRAVKTFDMNRHTTFAHYYRIIGDREVNDHINKVFRRKDMEVEMLEFNEVNYHKNGKVYTNLIPSYDKPMAQIVDEKRMLGMICESDNKIFTNQERDILLYKLQGYTYKSIGEMMGMNPKHVAYLHSRGMRKLEKKY